MARRPLSESSNFGYDILPRWYPKVQGHCMPEPPSEPGAGRIGPASLVVLGGSGQWPVSVWFQNGMRLSLCRCVAPKSKVVGWPLLWIPAALGARPRCMTAISTPGQKHPCQLTARVSLFRVFGRQTILGQKEMRVFVESCG